MRSSTYTALDLILVYVLFAILGYNMAGFATALWRLVWP
jgi:hypothetical protein